MSASKPRNPWRVILTQNGIQLAEVEHTSEAKAFQHVRAALQAGADTAKVMQWADGRWRQLVALRNRAGGGSDVTARHPATRIAAVRRHGPPVSDVEREAATALLVDLLAAAARHGVTADDLGRYVDLPAACLAVTVAKTRRG
jgi:hypothetical protein